MHTPNFAASLCDLGYNSNPRLELPWVDVDESAAAAAGAGGDAVVGLGAHPDRPLHRLRRQVGPVRLAGRCTARPTLQLLLRAAAEAEVIGVLSEKYHCLCGYV